ncbi:hypothetical protein GCM10011380_00920 [Sphingomonas metalli]|uniref:Uncharacterized protein n=1 Tax=Sphingomonas metalli TaxID=1779358 RepID=A0A916SS31_9SPHN|nr:hypothetical protein [Sphingomonas metalli]GGB15299.1 hypothetical protein GCM10011380_00920 [Sphingomonas metalli]
MGMFDDVQCEVPLPDGWEGCGLQTKDLGCTMSVVTITKDGRLVGDMREWWWSEHKPVRDLDFHGELTFYGHEGRQPGTPEWRWHEYVARFTEGQLVSIREASRDRDASSAEDAKRLSPEGVAARAEGIAQPGDAS